MATSKQSVAYGAWLLLVISLAGLIVATVDTLDQGNGIAYSLGAWLVLVSTVLLVVMSLVLTFLASRPRWLSGVLVVLILIDLLGTGVAAYFLDAYVLLALMVIGLLAWLVHLFVGRAGGRASNHAGNRMKAAS